MDWAADENSLGLPWRTCYVGAVTHSDPAPETVKVQVDPDVLKQRLLELDAEPSVWAASDSGNMDDGLVEVAGRLAPILARRGVADAAEARSFLSPSVDDLHDPNLLIGMADSVTRILSARSAGERVAIVGDYDVDGVSACALLLAVLRALKIEARPILPHRLRDGYGFQERQVEIAQEWGAKVIVTVDCGTTSDVAVAAAQAAGMDVIITDHHLPGEVGLPSGTLLVNPRQKGSRYPFPDLCGAGLALKLATALLKADGRTVPMAQLMRVACLGTIADVVPLRGENRVIAALGLESLGETNSPGLKALFKVSKVQAPLSSTDIGYRLGPRINAAGRLDSPDQALDLLLTQDPVEAERLATELDQLNTERRDEERLAVDQATEMFAALETLPGILIGWSPEWHRGIVGIAAGRIARRFRRPTVLLAQDEASATGSGRSIPGVHLFDFLTGFRDLMERFGGHAAAVGMTVSNEGLETLRGVAETAADWSPELFARRFEYELELAPGEYDRDLFERLKPLAPHGEGNREPILKVGPMILAGAPRVFGNGHLGFAAVGPSEPKGPRVQVVAWNWAERKELFEEPFEILGSAEWDSYLGLPSLRLIDARRVGAGDGGMDGTSSTV